MKDGALHSDLPSVRGTTRSPDPDLWRRKLQSLAAVYSTSPERSLRIGDIRNPLAVPGEVHVRRRDARKEGYPMFRGDIVPRQFAVRQVPLGENPLPVRAKDGREESQWSKGQLNRLSVDLPEKTFCFTDGPDVSAVSTCKIGPNQKDVIPPVGSPTASPLGAPPTGKQRMKTRSIDC